MEFNVIIQHSVADKRAFVQIATPISKPPFIKADISIPFNSDNTQTGEEIDSQVRAAAKAHLQEMIGAL